MKFSFCSGCMLLLHKHHLHPHQRHGDQRRGHRSDSEVTAPAQPVLQRCGAAQREHGLRKKSVPKV